MNEIRRTGWFSGLSKKERASRAAFIALILVSLVITAICLVNALKWVNKPFPGFLLNERMVVAPIGQYSWSGTQAGLKYPDKILKANGKDVPAVKDLEEVLRTVEINEPVNYTVERDGRQFERMILKMKFSFGDLMMTFGTTFLAGITYLLIEVIVFLMKPDTKVSWSFFVACLFLSMWSITIFDMQSTHFGFIRFYLLAAALFPAAFIHFSFYFPEPQNFVVRHPRFQLVPYLVALAIILPMEILYPQKSFAIFYSLSLLFMIIAALALLQPVTFAYFMPRSVLGRQRAKVVLLGAAIAFPLPAMAYFSQLIAGSFLGLRIQTNFLALLLFFFPASIAYAVAKHNLFDVDVYIKRAVGYMIMTGLIVGAYALLSVTFNIFVGQYRVAQSRAFPLLFTLGVILVFNPLRNRVQSFVDRVFFRKEYDYGEIIDKISGAIATLMDLGQVLRRLVQTFMEDLFIDTSSVMLLSPVGTEYRVYLADGEKRSEVEEAVLARSDPLLKIIEEERRELTKYDVLEDPKYKAVRDTCAASFEALNATLMVPMVFQDRVIGLITLGEKKSGKFFSREDIDLLHAIANQGAVAIENARLFLESLEKQRMEEELSIARDLQMSMLPSACPQIKGFEIAATCVPAREVGGDFFDFVAMGEEKLCFLVGDVTGKSVSGALVMSAVRSVFRMLSEEQLTVSDIMIRANRRAKMDIKSGMFVALLYALLDAKERTLTLCSAGQTQPIHYLAKTGESRLIQTEGDTFPLGILDEVEYKETRVQLECGDKLVFYTDGIVEAKNKEQELFGFERLLAVIRETKTMNSEELLKEIISRVNEFVGGAPQSDDLTVIVISVR